MASLSMLPACGVDSLHWDPHAGLEDVADECPIDRESECLLEDSESCDGYPTAGPSGWGYTVGPRLENIILYDAQGQPRELAELLAERRGPVCGEYSGAVVLDLGAEWCESCRRESAAIAGEYDHWRERGVDVLNILVGIKNWEGGSAELAADWPGEDEQGNKIQVPYPVWYADPEVADRMWMLHEPGQTPSESDGNGDGPSSSSKGLPLRVFLDANANIRWVSEGERPDPVVAIEESFEPVLADPFWNDRE